MIGSMASVPLPDATGAPMGDQSPLMGELSDQGFSVIVQIWPQWPRQLIRLSAHLYNTPDDYQALVDRLR
jgi:isopenicillin-N epimerase